MIKCGDAMETRWKKWKTWWWYHWPFVLVALAAAAVAVYSFLPNLLSPKPDCSLAVISTASCPEETLLSLKERFESLAEDENGDGRVLVQISVYTADLSGRTEGSVNYMNAAPLDADLVGRVSALFLLDDAAGFAANVVTPVADFTPCSRLPFFDDLGLSEDWVFTARTDVGPLPLYEQVLNYR